MALLRKLFARKAMDGLSHVSERVFVFNSCLSMGTLDEGAHKDYLTSTIIQLKGCNPHAALMVVNFAAAPTGTDAVHSLLRHGAAAIVADYPSRYGGCPSLPLPRIRAFLGSCVDWLVSGHQRNILLMHCDGNGAAWPALAFAMASLLVYIEEAAPERRTLDAVYGRAPVELLSACSALDPRPSHLRYLQYVARLRDKGPSLMGMKQEPFVLDCLILRAVPDFDGRCGCRPVVRVHSEPRAPLTDASSTEVLFSTPRIKQQFKHYKQAESAVIKADIGCQIQGDVVIECMHVGDGGHEEIMFSVMFSTCFLQSNMTVFTLEDIDLPWNCNKEKFQEDFKIEVFFSEVELSDADESNDECELSSIGNEDEFYDFEEILIDDSDFDQIDSQWHGETSRQEPNTNTEHSETRASDSTDSSSEENEEDGETGSSDSASNSADEKGNVSTDDEAELIIHGVDVTRETKDPRLGETSYLVEAGGSSSMPPIVPTRENINEEMPTDRQENISVEGIIPMEEGNQGVTCGVSEASHSNEAGYGAQSSQPMRKTRQKQAAIIPAVPIIRKKIRRPDTGPEKKPAMSKPLVRIRSPQGALAATSEAKASPSPQKQREIPNRLKQGSALAIRSSNLSKEDLKHSSQQQARGDPVARKHFASGTATRPEIRQIVFTQQTSPTFAPSPLGREVIQEGGEGSGNPMGKAKKPMTLSSEKPRIGKAPKQESPVTEAPRRTNILKKSMSSPAISATPVSSSGKTRTVTSLPVLKVNTSRPSSGFHIASSSSPRRQKDSVTPPSSPGRSPQAAPKFSRAAAVSQPDMQQGASAPIRLPRRASFSELSQSLSTSSASDVRSLSPKPSKVIRNHRETVKGSGRSLSPLSPRLATQPSPKSAAVVSMSSSKDKRSGTAPARPSRLSF